MPKLFKIFLILFTFVWCFTLTAQQNPLWTDADPNISSVQGQLDIPGDVLAVYDIEAITGETGKLGCEYAFGYLWVTARGLVNPPGSPAHQLWKIDISSGTPVLVASYLQGTTSTWGWRDLTSDGTYLYASDSPTIQQIDPATGLPTGVTIPGPISPNRALAYDPATDNFWTISFGGDLYEIDRTGAIVSQFPNPASSYGAGWDPWSPGGPFLWLNGGAASTMVQVDPLTGVPTGVNYSFGSGLVGGLDVDIDLVPGLVVGVGLSQETPDQVYVVELANYSGGTLTIAEAIEDLNGDFVPDRLGDIVTVQGVVFSPNFQSSNNSFYIDDGTAGTDIFMFGPPVFNWAMGDELEITGEVAQFNGMTEIIPADSSGWVLVSTGNPTPDPIVLTLAQYIADPEAYEGSLVGFVALDLVGGTWPTGGSTNLQFSDGIDTVTFRIDGDTDIPGQPEPTWPQDVIGIGSQFDSSTPPDGGYQIFPRFYDTDFLPPGTIPVELTSFTAQVNDGVVYLNWITATEQNNQGFEVQRRTNDEFTTIGFVNGYGTTTEVHNYSFIDTDVQTGTYYYRLKQIDFDGTFEYLDVVQVDISAPSTFSLEQNYPNPFNPSTIITFSLAIDSKVSLKVFDVLGQEVVNLITSNMTAGVHEVNFDAANLNSGVYFYRINASGVDGSDFTSVKKMILTK